MINISKSILQLLFALTILCSCNHIDATKTDTNQQTEITPTEKAAIKKQIIALLNEVIEGAKKLDVEAAAKPYSDDTDFKIVNPDGSVTDFKTMKNAQIEGFKGLAAMTFNTTKTEFTFLTRDFVICTWIGNNEFQLKTGEKMKIDPYVGTLIFGRKNNEWKIIYAHETTGQPVKVEDKNKN